MIVAHVRGQISARVQSSLHTYAVNTSTRMRQNFHTYASEHYTRAQSLTAHVCVRACARMHQVITLSVAAPAHVCKHSFHTYVTGKYSEYKFACARMQPRLHTYVSDNCTRMQSITAHVRSRSRARMQQITAHVQKFACARAEGTEERRNE
ncbi:hypothetical protein FACS189430_02730 [Bacteroidia bacterium]|nr:hypothetical protein FACS189430_02730 [Bacteroidia bacterium]